MPMTVVVTRDVPDRYRGFLASIMPEIGPGMFVSPELSRGVRVRIWTVLSGWWDGVPGGSIMMVWKDELRRRPPGAVDAGFTPKDIG